MTILSWTLGSETLLPALLVVPLLGTALVLAVPGWRGERWARPVGLAATLLTLAIAVVVCVAFDLGAAGRVQLETDARWAPAIGLHWHLGVDGASLPLVVLTALLSACCLLHLRRTLPSPGRARALVALLLVLEVGMIGTFLARDLVLFFLFFEVVLLPMWGLVAVWGDEKGRAAADKFLLYTVLGSAVMLVGFLLVYARTGTLDMGQLATAGGSGMSRGAQVAAFALISLGLAVKTPMWPLHTWLPDAHTAAPTVGSVLLAGVLLKMGTYGFVRIAVPVAPEGARVLAPVLAVLGVVGIVYGSLACLAQHDLKRLIAYSSVGHMGFVLLGVASLTPAGLNGALFASVAHGLVTGLLFFLVGAVKERDGTTDLGRLRRGLYARAPRLGGLVALGAVASLGLPGLAGFWGEFLAMYGAWQPGGGLGRPLFVALTAVAALATVLVAAYLLLVVRLVAQGGRAAAGDADPATYDLDRVELLAFAPLALGVVVLGLWPGLLVALTDPAVRGLLQAAS